MSRFIAALLFFFIGNIETHAQPWWEYLDRTPERIIGLLDLPDIVGEGCGTTVKQTPAPVYDAPTQNSRRAGMFSLIHDDNLGCVYALQRAEGANEPAPTLETGYEIPATPVYERRGAWFRMGLKEWSAWIRRSAREDFLAYPEVLRESLAHTMQTWDGTIRAAPGPSGQVTPLSPGWKALLDRHLSIEYLGSRRAGNVGIVGRPRRHEDTKRTTTRRKSNTMAR